ncbi:RrF2 family transcriptional regulator [Gelidibacter salicanalis]|uniref:Rrf2 family transcriptional regulator n=1 Tax=Gelidibacter salicanalis TaxID=291193 RepID=A0A934KMJ0_9FLAO|nr:Rrf2 family transcriptional regulator [Gelidibacter salicanalis]MBJ7881962.1 Rrf2 family transcriptional regulator [Gelidibacter salicanalis]
MLSNTCKTAIKAVIYLASKEEAGEKLGVKEISQYINASEHTVSKILQNLVRQKIIMSIKGPSGGFYITKEQQLQPIITIVDTIDGKDLFEECGLGLSKCSSSHPCPIHDDYKKGREIIQELFKTKTINVLCEPVGNGLAYLIG